MATTSNWESFLSPQEVRVYPQFFAAANGGKSNVVQGREAVQFFVRSGIPNEILSDIWETADRDNLGYLTAETFSIALKLIACAQHGHDVGQPILSTVVALPQFEGFNPDLTPISPGATAGPVDIVAPSEREKYLSIFRAHQPVQGLLEGAKAREIFLRSKLHQDILEQIWNLANVRKSGNLNQTEFVIAMHYIARMMDGTLPALPSQLPASVYGSAAGSISSSPVIRRTSVSPISRQTTGSSTISQMAPLPPPSRLNKVSTFSGVHSAAMATGVPAFGSKNSSSWEMSPQQRQQFDATFDRLDSHHTGFLPGGEAGKFFKNSHLPEAELARIWDLADTEQRGQLTRHEFANAMFLIQKRLAGEPLPSVLPASLTPIVQQRPDSSAVGILAQPPFFQSPPSIAAQSPPTQNLVVQEPLGDLLGDFDNAEQLTETTNAVNQLQFQIKTENSTLDQVKIQKQEVLQQLKQLREETEHSNTQMKQLLEHVEAEKMRLSELQNGVNNEEPGWNSTRQEHDVAQKRLEKLRGEIIKTKATLDERKYETERLRREVHAVQKQKDSYVEQLNRLREYVKNQEKPSPSFDDIFATPTFESQQLAHTAPAASQATHQVDPSDPQQDALASEFDALFGPSFNEPKRQAPPPPPPPHRRTTVRRPETATSGIVSSTVSPPAASAPKKQRAPPPPPPSAAAAAATAIAAVANPAVTSSILPGQEADDTDADTTTTEDDSEDEIPLSDLKVEATKTMPIASGGDVDSEDMIPLASTSKVSPFGMDEASYDGSDMLESTRTATTEVLQSDVHEAPSETAEVDIVTSQEAIRDDEVPAAELDHMMPEIDNVNEAKLETEPEVQQDVRTGETAELEDSKTETKECPVDHVSSSKEDAEMPAHEAKPVAESQNEDGTAGGLTTTAENDGIHDLSTDALQAAVINTPVTITETGDNEIPSVDVSNSQNVEAKKQSDEPQDVMPLEKYTTDTPETGVDSNPITADQGISQPNKANSTLYAIGTILETDSAISAEKRPTAEDEQGNKVVETISPTLSKDVAEIQPIRALSMESSAPAQESGAVNQEEASSSSGGEENVKEAGEGIEKDDDKEIKATTALATSAAVAAIIHGIDTEGDEPGEPVNTPEIQEPSAENTRVQEYNEEESIEAELNVEREYTDEDALAKFDAEKPAVQKTYEDDEPNVHADEMEHLEAREAAPVSEEICVPSTGAANSSTSAPDKEDKESEIAMRSQPIRPTTPNTSEDEDDFQSVVSDGVIAMDDSTMESPEQRPSAQEFASTALVSSQEEAAKSPGTSLSSDVGIAEDGEPQNEDERAVPLSQQSTNPVDAVISASTATSDDPFSIRLSEAEEDTEMFTEEDRAVATKQELQSPVDDNELQNDFDAVFMERHIDKAEEGSPSSDYTTGENESFEMISSNASVEKHKPDDGDEDEFDAAFDSELLQDATVVANIPEKHQQQPMFDDDFDAAFSSDLMDAKIVSDNNTSNPFGDSVENTEIPKDKPKLTWASNFGGFDFGQDEEDQKTSEEWDAIFGGGVEDGGYEGAATAAAGIPDAVEENAAVGFVGFEDSFDGGEVANPESSEPEHPQEPKPTPAHAVSLASASTSVPEPLDAAPEPASARVAIGSGSNLDQLLAMGFDRASAKDALNRYDQDLEKATNFLLDN